MDVPNEFCFSDSSVEERFNENLIRRGLCKDFASLITNKYFSNLKESIEKEKLSLDRIQTLEHNLAEAQNENKELKEELLQLYRKVNK